MIGHIGEIEYLKPKSNPTVLEGVLEIIENEKEGDGLDGVFEALFVMLRNSDQKFTRFSAKILSTLFTAFVNTVKLASPQFFSL